MVFLAGYVPAWLSARNAREEGTRLAQRADNLELLAQLGMANFESGRNNFATAAEHAGRFFDGVQSAIQRTADPERRQTLQSFLGRRAEVLSDLAQANVLAKEKLSRLYAGFYEITRHSRSASAQN